jgi:hypothetical protein
MPKLNKIIVSSILGTAFLGGLVFAKPEVNTSAKKHPHINAAQQSLVAAAKQITDAQAANEWDMDGHAKKAKELIDQADAELKQAAEAANANAPKK